MTSILTKDLLDIAEALADSDAFQEWIGEDNDPDDHIFFFNVAVEDAPDKFVLLYHGQNWERNTETFQGQIFISDPEVVLHFEEEIDKTIAMSTGFVSLMESVGDIMDDLEDAEQTAGIQQWSIDPDDPSRANKRANTDRQRVQVIVQRVPWDSVDGS